MVPQGTGAEVTTDGLDCTDTPDRSSAAEAEAGRFSRRAEGREILIVIGEG